MVILHITPSLRDILLVPQITRNILFVSQFSKDNDAYFEFHPNPCYIKFQASKVTSLEGAHDSDDLYRFFSLLVKKTTSSISGGIQVTSPTVNNDVQSQASTSSILSIWHRRLGHAHYEAIRSILQN
ncbi:unnamed protein product [Vicia faba]|uniref:GAG-pre-integrase domain-containing protein n=1 Tax=Vicia faba TaxID=3906 RepID=A0AAV0ZTL6_VICFA|nr:unnamed protein product [Vicia faba]